MCVTQGKVFVCVCARACVRACVCVCVLPLALCQVEFRVLVQPTSGALPCRTNEGTLARAASIISEGLCQGTTRMAIICNHD